MSNLKVEEVYIVQLNGCPVSCYEHYLDARIKETELYTQHQGEARVEVIRLPVLRGGAK